MIESDSQETSGGEIERRRFIRHPLSYPLRTKILKASPETPGEKGETEFHSTSEDIGAGGLLFICEKEIPVGTEVEIHLRVEHRCFTLDGKVVRATRGEDGRNSIAVAFSAPDDLLKVRMMEQIVRIEIFKTRMERRYGVTLDFGAVAKEWIRRYSKAFAKHYDL